MYIHNNNDSEVQTVKYSSHQYSRLMVENCEAKKKQHVSLSLDLRHHFSSKLFTFRAALKSANTVTKLL